MKKIGDNELGLTMKSKQKFHKIWVPLRIIKMIPELMLRSNISHSAPNGLYRIIQNKNINLE